MTTERCPAAVSDAGPLIHLDELGCLDLLIDFCEVLVPPAVRVRIVATQAGFRVHGTIGVLLRSARKGRRSARDVLHLLESLPTLSTLHVRPSLLEQITSEAKREFGLR